MIAIQDAGFPDSVPSMRFVLDDARSDAHVVDAGPGWSTPLYLIRGEPVSITIVNQTHEATAVHWHGIEVESYFDGVADLSGSGRKLAPIIAPQDSFEARFTPPRAGTFIYHSHVDEPRQHRAGLVGALIVRDTALRSASEDLILLIKSARAGRGPPNRFEINGRTDPDTIVLALGHSYRLRVIAMQTGIPGPVISITARPDSSLPNLRDTLIVRWRQVAKDGADLPDEEGAKPARQSIGMGETYDFQFIPERRGLLRIEVRSARGLMVRAPIRVD
jgi:FtsP/CotA-like multicopper oxidase with cupredoxin domain